MEIKQIEKANAYNCLLVSVATLAKHCGRDYHMIAGSDWKLRYDADLGNKRIGEQIDILSQVDAAFRAFQFHGFTWKFEGFEECFINADSECFKDFTYPFLGSIDLYYSKWSKFYHRHHFLHYLIIYGYNHMDRTYLCIDPYFNYEHYKISKEDLYKGLEKCGRLSFFSSPPGSAKEHIEAIREDIMMVGEGNENYRNIKRLSYDIYNNMDINYEFDEFKNDLHAVPVLDRIRKVAIHRDSYTCMLNYVYKKFELVYLLDASSLIEQSVALWRTIQGKLLKTYLTNSMSNERESISKMLEQIADIEKQAVEIILCN